MMRILYLSLLITSFSSYGKKVEKTKGNVQEYLLEQPKKPGCTLDKNQDDSSFITSHKKSEELGHKSFNEKSNSKNKKKGLQGNSGCQF